MTTPLQAEINLRANRLAKAREIAARLGALLGVSAEDVLGHSRKPPLPLLRHQLMTDLWQDGMSLSDVARTLGMDHSTVIYGVRRTMGREEYAATSPGSGAGPKRAVSR